MKALDPAMTAPANDFDRFLRHAFGAALALSLFGAAALRLGAGTPSARGFAVGAVASVLALWFHARAVRACGAAEPAQAESWARRGVFLRLALRAGAGILAALVPGISLPAALAGLLITPVAILAAPIVAWTGFGARSPR